MGGAPGCEDVTELKKATASKKEGAELRSNSNWLMKRAEKKRSRETSGWKNRQATGERWVGVLVELACKEIYVLTTTCDKEEWENQAVQGAPQVLILSGMLLLPDFKTTLRHFEGTVDSSLAMTYLGGMSGDNKKSSYFN